MYVYAPCVCLVPVEVWRGHQILWNWLQASVQVLGITSESSGQAAIGLSVQPRKT